MDCHRNAAGRLRESEARVDLFGVYETASRVPSLLSRILRRRIQRVAAALSVGLALVYAPPASTQDATQISSSSVDYRALVSQADLMYRSPAQSPVEGLPIGNGRMGTLVWTDPGALHLQINRNDVFAVNKHHAGKQTGPDDYCGACAQVTIDVGGDTFTAGPSFTQRLSLYDAETTIEGEGLSIRCFVSAVTDVLVLEIDDRRPTLQQTSLRISMWRPPEVVHGSHIARYEFTESADTPVVVQRFQEADYHCASAVAARIVGGGVGAQSPDDRSRTVIAPPGNGKTTILISSAASWAAGAEVSPTAVGLLKEAGKSTYMELRAEHTRWWHEFWSRTFVNVSSPDGIGEFMARVRNLHLYHMAATSRGALPPKWNGSLFITAGDERDWGTQFWVWTTEMLYLPLLAADAIDLTEPYFDMYARQLPECEKAASQRWGLQGAYFPETAAFDGPVILPEPIGSEFQDVLLGRKEAAELSDEARALCQFDSQLRVVTNPHEGRYSWISHVASSGSELAVQAWWRYRYTGDTRWLRTHAYPLLRGTVEFYRHLVRKEDDGLYHTHGTNAHEDFWGVKDGIMDLAAIRGTAPLAIRASEILNVDASLAAKWRELLDNLAPYPMGRDPQSKALTGGVLSDTAWAAGHLGDVDGQHNPEDMWLTPVFPFEDWTLETRSPAVDRIVAETLDLAPRHASVLNGSKLGTAIRTPIVVARAGRGDELPATLACYYAAFSSLPNGMSQFEGPNAQSIEHLGLLTTALQEGLLQSVSPRPGESEVISVAPAWPREWDASFRLLARGGFLVTSAVRNGEVRFVEIESRRGGRCRLRNPWSGTAIVSEADGTTQELKGAVLSLDTTPGQRYRLTATNAAPSQPHPISPTPATEPASYSLTLPNGETVGGTLGRR